jgi:hypothetical protein
MDNIHPAIEAMEAFDAIHKVLGNLMEGLPDIPNLLEYLDHISVDGVGFKLLDVVDGDTHEKKGFLTIYSSADPILHQSSCTITELEENESNTTESSYNPIDHHVESDAMMSDDEAPSSQVKITTHVPKKQKKIAKDVTEVRRSSRVAKLCDGYKEKEAADMAKEKMTEKGTPKGDNTMKKQKTKMAKKSSNTSFSAAVINSTAPPPLELPGNWNWPMQDISRGLMSTHASVLVDSVGPPSAEVCRAAASFP